MCTRRRAARKSPQCDIPGRRGREATQPPPVSVIVSIYCPRCDSVIIAPRRDSVQFCRSAGACRSAVVKGRS